MCVQYSKNNPVTSQRRIGTLAHSACYKRHSFSQRQRQGYFCYIARASFLNSAPHHRYRTINVNPADPRSHTPPPRSAVERAAAAVEAFVVMRVCLVLANRMDVRYNTATWYEFRANATEEYCNGSIDHLL